MTKATRPMTNKQIEYACGRADDIRHRRLLERTSALPHVEYAEPPSTRWTNEEMLEMIKNGTAKLGDNLYTRIQLIEAYEYPEKVIDATARDEYIRLTKEREAEVQRIHREEGARLSAFKDKLYLGDSAAALAALEEFSK